MCMTPNQKAQQDYARSKAIENSKGVDATGAKTSNSDSFSAMTPV
jgi:hypothetical protein